MDLDNTMMIYDLRPVHGMVHLRLSSGQVVSQLRVSANVNAFREQVQVAMQAEKSPPIFARKLEHVVKPGETLSAVCKAHLRANGVEPTPAQLERLMLAVARGSGVSDPNRIFPGDLLDLSSLVQSTGLPQASPSAQAAASVSVVAAGGRGGQGDSDWRAIAGGRTLSDVMAIVNAAAAADVVSRAVAGGATPVLDRTLDRAVSLGYVPSADRDAVHARITRLATDYGFSPDDFALVGLIESDGFNPRASNGNCHGIIQFCDGPGRGAASAGYGSNPRSILDMSVLQQLDLVDRYFADTGLERIGGAGLADLYLTVLTPAARAERNPSQPLKIAGTQAAVLYEGQDRQASITRHSLEHGLRMNGAQRLDLPEIITPQSRVPMLRVREHG